MPSEKTTAAAAAAARTGADAKGESARPRRRQARGERRIAQLLDAAATVFSETGYAAASTNAIARAAGVSPGTLYQFFPNKEAIAVELSSRFLHQMRAAHSQAFTPANIGLPLARMLDAVTDPFIEFNCQNPAFTALMHGSNVPGRIVEDHNALHSALVARVEQLLGAYLPDTPAADRTRIAEMAFAIFKAGVELAMAQREEDRDAYVAELKTSLYRYLCPIIGDDVLPHGDLPDAALPLGPPESPESPESGTSD